jgi:hypothetical protein
MIDHDVRDPLSSHVPPLGSPLQETGEAMVPIILSVQHGWTLEEVRDYLETAVPKVYRQVGSLVRRVTRSADHRPVPIDGAPCSGDMGGDVQDIHASVEIVLLERLLGNDMATEFRNILQQTVQRERP